MPPKPESTTEQPTNSESIELVSFDPEVERESQLKEAYGNDNFDQVLKIDEELLKAEWEAYNHKVKLLDPIYKKRSEFIKKIPGFWLKAMTNDPRCNSHVDAVDRNALTHLEDLTIEHDPKDARNVTFHFHFAKENPYFSDRVLTKKFTVVEEEKSVGVNGSSTKPHPKLTEMNQKYDLDHPVKSTAVQINWTSDEHNLVAKKPTLSFESIEDEDGEVDFNDAFGSFFNFFSYEEDRFELHNNLLELHSKALDLYAGVLEANDEELGMDEDEEDEEDEDPNAVVDLESENDEPKKKKVKVAA